MASTKMRFDILDKSYHIEPNNQAIVIHPPKVGGAATDREYQEILQYEDGQELKVEKGEFLKAMDVEK